MKVVGEDPALSLSSSGEKNSSPCSLSDGGADGCASGSGGVSGRSSACRDVCLAVLGVDAGELLIDSSPLDVRLPILNFLPFKAMRSAMDKN